MITDLHTRTPLPNWKEIVKQRDGYRCVYSEQLKDRDHSAALEVNHLLPKAYGGQDTPDNGITVCRNCHLQYHPELEQRFFSQTIKGFFRSLSQLLKKFTGSPEERYLWGVEYLTGSKQFRSRQLEIVKEIIEQKSNVMVVMPTGAGKSLLYQLPGILDSGQSLVISPLISLMTNQVGNLQARWIPATYINSTLDPAERARRIQVALHEGYKFVFAHPKQFIANDEKTDTFELRTRNLLLQAPFTKLVIDEAHVVEHWGINFTKEYSRLHLLIKQLKQPQVILLSASISKEMQKWIISNLELTDCKVFVTGYSRPEITLKVVQLDTLILETGARGSRFEYIAQEVQKPVSGKTLIFVPTKKIGHEVADYLKAKGTPIDFYHGGLPPETRMHLQQCFLGKHQPEINVLLCTSAFGMGVDVPNIRKVIHYCLPASLNDYYQQLGRAARDGKPAEAILLFERQDPELISYMNRVSIDQNHPSAEMIKTWQKEELAQMLGYVYAENKWQYILDYFGDRSSNPVQKHITIILIFVFALVVLFFLFVNSLLH